MTVSVSIIGICWLVFLLYWVISSFFVKKSVDKRHRWMFLARIVVIILVIIFLEHSNNLQNAERVWLKVFFQGTPLFSVLGVALTIIGLAGAIWSRTVLGRNWSGYVTYKKDHELVTGGPYKYIRHPIYSSMALMFIGSFISFPSIYLLFIFMIMMSVFLWRIRREEAIMIKLFGKRYKDYMKRTKRFIPGIY